MSTRHKPAHHQRQTATANLQPPPEGEGSSIFIYCDPWWQRDPRFNGGEDDMVKIGRLVESCIGNHLWEHRLNWLCEMLRTRTQQWTISYCQLQDLAQRYERAVDWDAVVRDEDQHRYCLVAEVTASDVIEATAYKLTIPMNMVAEQAYIRHYGSPAPWTSKERVEFLTHEFGKGK